MLSAWHSQLNWSHSLITASEASWGNTACMFNGCIIDSKTCWPVNSALFPPPPPPPPLPLTLEHRAYSGFTFSFFFNCLGEFEGSCLCSQILLDYKHCENSDLHCCSSDINNYLITMLIVLLSEGQEYSWLLVKISIESWSECFSFHN